MTPYDVMRDHCYHAYADLRAARKMVGRLRLFRAASFVRRATARLEEAIQIPGGKNEPSSNP